MISSSTGSLLFAALLSSSSPSSPREERVVIEAPGGALSEERLAEFECKSLRAIGAAWIRFSETAKRESGEAENLGELELQSGDHLRGRVVDGDEDGLIIELAGGVRLPLPIDGIRSLVFADRLPADGTALLQPAEEGDRLYRRIGDHLDRIDGAVVQFSATGVQFESVLGARKFEWGEIGALFIESFDDGPAPATSPGESIVCDLVDGSRLRGELLGLDRRGCRLRIGGSEELQLPISVLSEVSLDDGSVAFLSDLKPTGIDEGSPFGDDLGMTWPHRMDRSVTGERLRCGGQSFLRGIGVHAPSKLSFALDGNWNELRGLVGIDDQVMRLHARGSVILRVIVDGKLAFESGVVRGGVPPIELPAISLTGAKELILECDMATEFAVADRANWLRMVLVKTPK